MLFRNRSSSKDHCPPLSLFSRKTRQQHNLSQLVTIPVHENCNACYKLDEEYFKATMVPFARGSEAGNSIFKEFMANSQKETRKLTLAKKILREFEPRPSGLHLSRGLVVKRQDGARIKRVAWKIVRGLYFYHHGAILPDSFSVDCTLTPRGRPLPEHIRAVIGLLEDEGHGHYPGAFDYQFFVVETDLGRVHFWTLLFWNQILVTVSFHDPWSCQCEDCTSAVAKMEIRTRRPVV